jgi:hypothetical protein
VSTSPARSTFSLASTLNLYQTVHEPSATTTPAKVPPPSPLYYDYTEDFDIDVYNQPVPLEPPPQFRIEKTIPEDRPLSSECTSLDSSDMRSRKTIFSSDFRNSSTTASSFHQSVETTKDPSVNGHSANIFGQTQGHPSHETAAPAEVSYETAAVSPGTRKTIPLSVLGIGARELSTHVEEAFGLLPTPSFEVIVSNSSADERKFDDKMGVTEQNDVETQSIRTSSYSLNTHLSRFPSPPRHLDGQFSETDAAQVVTLKSSARLPLPLRDSLNPPVSHTGNKEPTVPSIACQIIGSSTDSLPARSSSVRSDRKRLSRHYSIDNGLTDLDDFVNVFEDANRTEGLGEKRRIQDSCKVLHAVPSSLPKVSVFDNVSSGKRCNPKSTSFNQLHNEDDHKGLPDQSLKRGRRRYRPRRLEAITVPIGSEIDVPNFSHQLPKKLMSRSELPVLAPKPISPARQLKLKNSIPQLMKALPPIPPEPSICAASPPFQLASSEVELPCRFSPLIPESRGTPPQELPRSTEVSYRQAIYSDASTESVSEPVEMESVLVTASVVGQVKEEQKAPTPPRSHPPKLKLKMRSSSPFRPASPTEHHPWNSEESYLWSSQTLHIGLPSVVKEEKAANQKPPKFKLKITRASNSTIGTVRVNREPGDPKHSTRLHLCYPKDLFTPT